MSPPKSARPLKNGHRTIAVLGTALTTGYAGKVLFGAHDCGLTNGYNVICFVGGPKNDTDLRLQTRHQVFDIIDPEMVDGVVVLLSTLTRYMTPQEIAEFMRPFKGKPVATVGAKFEDCISVTADNENGMHQLLKHLIEDHGYRKIGFASGAPNHTSSNEKLKAYIDTLNEYGIPFDPTYVGYGPLNRRTSDWCAELFLDERKLELDVIVSVNDNQAFGIMESFKARSLRMPQDIAITGCMDLMECTFSTPSLTSVREPMYELGWAATKAVIGELNGEPGPSDVMVPTELIIRHSCGCSSAQIKQHQLSRKKPDLTLALHPKTQTDILVHTMREAEVASTQTLNSAINIHEIKHLAQRFARISKPELIAPAIESLANAIDTHQHEDAMTAWQAIIPAVQRHMSIRFHKSGSEDAMNAMGAQFEALYTDVTQKAFNYRNMLSEKYISAFLELSLFMNASFEREPIRHLIVNDLGAKECFISLYEDKNKTPGRVKNILAIRDTRIIDLQPEQQSFPASEIIPPCIKTYHKPYALLVLPMAFYAEPIGLIAVNLFDRKGIVLENLVALLSGALKTEMQIQDLKDAEQRFSDIALSASDWLWEVDADYRYTFCSEGVEHVLGYRADEMIGQSLFEFVLPSETEYLDLTHKHLLPNRLDLTNLEHINIHKDGHEVTLIISGKPIIKNDKLLGYRGAFTDATEVRSHQNKIRQLAYNDTLTGLPNRVLFNDRLQMILASAEREPRKFGVFFLDLDRFKHINDTLGHDAGDMLLQSVAARLTRCLRDDDTLARLGGDEFTIIVTHASANNDLAIVAHRIIKELSMPVEIKGHQLLVTASVGIAVYPEDGKTAVDLLKNADKAMYQAKEGGKNNFSFYDAKMGEKSDRRMLLETLLRQALSEERLELHYQPQVNALSCEIIGMEALIRLTTAELGQISPSELITLAEEIGLIEEIGLWVFTTACKQALSWEKKGYKQKVAINISARQLKNRHLAQIYIAIAQGIGVSPALIEIEITENAVIDNEKITKETLDQFSAYGFSIALDDFGTGFSSLSSLKKFPIDTIKIDRFFINDAQQNSDSVKLINAIIQIAKSLEMNVIAEGVETQEQLNLLRALGCTEIQGYLFSKPMTAGLLDKALLRRRINLSLVETSKISPLTAD